MAIIFSKIIKDLFSGIKSFFSVFFNFLGNSFFKSILFPVYKIGLFFKKHLNKYLIHNPYINYKQDKDDIKQRSIFHIIITVIAVFVITINITTRNTYAEDFNKNSIIAQIVVDDFSELIIEESSSIETISERPKTESVAKQLSVLETQKNLILKDTAIEDNKVALSQGGEALITPTITPFENQSENTTITPNKTNNEIKTYVVKAGDTLSTIAEQFGITINTILWENNLSLNSYIRPGDELDILPVTGVTYSVKSGDTLGKIANSFDTDVNKIISFNNLDPESPIRIRQTLIIPDGRLGATSLTPTRSISSSSTAASSSGTASAGGFLWPSTSKRITQYYHWGHNAIDIGAKSGTPIYAMKAGRVEHAGWGTGYGYYIIVDHGGGVKSLYAHSQRLYVERGDQVEQGEVMGEVGSTGWSTGPHIHLEIRINGTKVNPLSYL